MATPTEHAGDKPEPGRPERGGPDAGRRERGRPDAVGLSPGATVAAGSGPVTERPPGGPRAEPSQAGHPVRRWLLEGLTERSTQHHGPHTKPTQDHRGHPWWQVMCLTGVDYFSTLGYQPAIAALAAGAVSPIATLVLVLLTLFGALPVYHRVARESPHGEGSISMLERLLPFWRSKILVLVLLGFAATDFIITVTLSTADATAHVAENPFVPNVIGQHPIVVTLVLVALLGAVFLAGFGEAIRIAVVLVGLYLALNAVLVAVALGHVFGEPSRIGDWTRALTTQHANPLLVIGVALLVFPKLALGLSGFETGVAVMPLVRGGQRDTHSRPAGRIRNTRTLLTTAALIMSAFLVTSSFATVVLIPEKEFQPGGAANGRALAYLAHQYLGNWFGTVYDLSTISILWFAGASAMAGLLNLVPRYLPRYGMAPSWARAVRPLVLVFTLVGFLITVIFKADVDAQGGAYATGVLVLITTAALAVALSSIRSRRTGVSIGFTVITVVFGYTTVTNIIERPEGVKIAACFIGAIMVVSLVSRLLRAFELRVTAVHLDRTARRLIREVAGGGPVRLIANEPDARDSTEYRLKGAEERTDHNIPADAPVLFVEITVTDPSDFEEELYVLGEERHGYRVLRARSSTVPNALAALMLTVRDLTGAPPHMYFEWTEGSPFVHLLRFLMFGVGEVAPVTREVLRLAEPDRDRRPMVHVS